MQQNKKLSITPLAITDMTIEQLDSLKKNIVAEGQWDTADGANIWSEWGTIMVSPFKWEANGNEKTLILIGIEKDGYTHS